MPKITIYVAYHKPAPIVRGAVYQPIHVGKALSIVDIPGTIGDDTGDNISLKNPLYCEMTAVYWAWKNDLDSDYIGLCHYRRFFSFQRLNWIKRSLSWLRLIKAKFMVFFRPNADSVVFETINNPNKMQFESLIRHFEQQLSTVTSTSHIDGFYSRPMVFPSHSVKTQFDTLGSYHNQIVDEIIKTDYPDYYHFFKLVLSGNKISPCNMVIFRRTIFNDYCSFVFGVLDTYEKRLLADQWCSNLNDKCVARLPGFMAEILTSVFIMRLRSENKTLIALTQLYYEA